MASARLVASDGQKTNLSGYGDPATHSLAKCANTYGGLPVEEIEACPPSQAAVPRAEAEATRRGSLKKQRSQMDAVKGRKA